MTRRRRRSRSSPGDLRRTFGSWNATFTHGRSCGGALGREIFRGVTNVFLGNLQLSRLLGLPPLWVLLPLFPFRLLDPRRIMSTHTAEAMASYAVSFLRTCKQCSVLFVLQLEVCSLTRASSKGGNKTKATYSVQIKWHRNNEISFSLS